MKQILFLVLISISFSSCMYVGNFGRRPLYLVGAPDDIKVKHNGKKVDVKEKMMANLITRRVSNDTKERTKYFHPAILVKVRRNNKFEFSSGGKTVQVDMKGKAGKGILFLVLETPITLGIGPIVDLATVSFFFTESKYIDINAVFTNTPAKRKKELYNMALENSRKEHFTETKIN